MIAPKTLQYQGKELHLAESRIMPEVKGSPTRFVFVDRGGNAALMQWEFEGYPIDWERLQAENKDAPQFSKREKGWQVAVKKMHTWQKKHPDIMNKHAAMMRDSRKKD